MSSNLALLRLFQLVSPNAPTGAFGYSQGLEWAVECGWITSERQVEEWVTSTIQGSLQTLELPILMRLYQRLEKADYEGFEYWCDYLYASRETQELRLEEQQRSTALWMMLSKLDDLHDCDELHQLQASLCRCQIGAFALAAMKWSIPLDQLVTGYSWSWLENTIAAAIKLVPLGQSQGQQLLLKLSDDIVTSCRLASDIVDEQVGSSTFSLSIASSLHETQYSRLFRS